MNRNLLILDKEDYAYRKDEFLNITEQYLDGNIEIMFTSYEDNLIRKVRNIRCVGSALQHILYWKKNFNYARKVKQGNYDKIYSVNPIVGLFLGLMNKNKMCRIVLGGFLFEAKKNKFYYDIRKKITSKALEGIDIAVVYGSKEVEYYKGIFGNVTEFKFIKFGMDFKTSHKYTKSNLPERYFFSGGGSNRDYKTLIDAYHHLPKSKLPLIIATQPWRLAECDCSDLLVLEDVIIENFGDVLSRSTALVLSLKECEISAGHMVMFQAMSLGVPIIVNDIPSIRDYVSDTEVIFYRSRNADELAQMLSDIEAFDLSKAFNAKHIYETELTFDKFLHRFLRC